MFRTNHGFAAFVFIVGLILQMIFFPSLAKEDDLFFQDALFAMVIGAVLEIFAFAMIYIEISSITQAKVKANAIGKSMRRSHQ